MDRLTTIGCPWPIETKRRIAMRLRGSHILRGLTLASALTTAGVLSLPATPLAQSIAQQETMMSVRQALERLPYYGVFDFLSFDVDRGTVTLQGGGLADLAKRRPNQVGDVLSDLHGRFSISLCSGGFPRRLAGAGRRSAVPGDAAVRKLPDSHHREARSHDAGW